MLKTTAKWMRNRAGGNRSSSGESFEVAITMVVCEEINVYCAGMWLHGRSIVGEGVKIWKSSSFRNVVALFLGRWRLNWVRKCQRVRLWCDLETSIRCFEWWRTFFLVQNCTYNMFKSPLLISRSDEGWWGLMRSSIQGQWTVQKCYYFRNSSHWVVVFTC